MTNSNGVRARLSAIPGPWVNVRQSADVNSADLGDLRVGDTATIFDNMAAGWWYVVGDNGVTGYIARQGGKVVFTALDAAPASAYEQGIDVSSAQTPLDWPRVKAAGYTFAFVRATQGDAHSKPVGADTRFRAHIDAALAAGLLVGVYHAFIASVDGAAQAHFLHDTTAPYADRLAFPLVIDVELDNGQTPDVITGRLFDMASTLFALGHGLPMIYTSQGFWNGKVGTRNDDYFAQCPLWIASWTSASTPALPRTWKSWSIWQYSSSGRIDGYSKSIDLNRRKQ